MSDKKFANLDRKSLDRLNDMQHEITDAEGKGVILVAFDRDCGGCRRLRLPLNFRRRKPARSERSGRGRG